MAPAQPLADATPGAATPWRHMDTLLPDRRRLLVGTIVLLGLLVVALGAIGLRSVGALVGALTASVVVGASVAIDAIAFGGARRLRRHLEEKLGPARGVPSCRVSEVTDGQKVRLRGVARRSEGSLPGEELVTQVLETVGGGRRRKYRHELRLEGVDFELDDGSGAVARVPAGPVYVAQGGRSSVRECIPGGALVELVGTARVTVVREDSAVEGYRGPERVERRVVEVVPAWDLALTARVVDPAPPG